MAANKNEVLEDIIEDESKDIVDIALDKTGSKISVPASIVEFQDREVINDDEKVYSNIEILKVIRDEIDDSNPFKNKIQTLLNEAIEKLSQ